MLNLSLKIDFLYLQRKTFGDFTSLVENFQKTNTNNNSLYIIINEQ